MCLCDPFQVDVYMDITVMPVPRDTKGRVTATHHPLQGGLRRRLLHLPAAPPICMALPIDPTCKYEVRGQGWACRRLPAVCSSLLRTLQDVLQRYGWQVFSKPPGTVIGSAPPRMALHICAIWHAFLKWWHRWCSQRKSPCWSRMSHKARCSSVYRLLLLTV